MKRYVFTCGDINGIGPEICIKTFNRIFNPKKNLIYFICPLNIFKKTVKKIPLKFDYQIVKEYKQAYSSVLNVVDVGSYKQKLGSPTKISGQASFISIQKALELFDLNYVDALITAPISKYSFQLAGIDFPGHTEMLAAHFNSKLYSMLFLSNKIKVALVTIHIPLKAVAKSITKNNVSITLEVLRNSLKNDFGIKQPKIAILGLNPHAGEDGKIGTEEKNIIYPVIRKNKNVFGPFVPDAFFGMKKYLDFDAVIGMYHDQVLIPFKLLNFEKGVNYTAGLPIVRTSPDHGTAFDIASKFVASEVSMIESYKWAEKILKFRKLK